MFLARQLPRTAPLHAVNRIAHPTDLTKSSENALTWSVELAQTSGAELLLLHVIPPPTPIFEAEPPLKAEAAFELSLLLERVKLNDVRARGFVLYGTKSIDHQILQAVQLERADLVVMGTSRRTGFSRLLAGSVASRLVTRAHCPVLVIPNQIAGQPQRSKVLPPLGL